MAIVLLTVRGFAAAYWRKAVEPLIRTRATNLTIPVPWPWRLPFSRPVTWAELAALATGGGFVALPVVVVVAVGLLVGRVRRVGRIDRPVLLAATATAAVWSHHAFARADRSHLSQAIAPLLIATVALPTVLTGRWQRAAAAAVWPAAVLVTLMVRPALSPVFDTRFSITARASWQRVGGERLYVPRGAVAACRAVAEVAARNGPGQTNLFVPYAPGLYAVLRLPCPAYESYPLWPATTPEQAAVIKVLESRHAAAIVCWSARLDGRQDLGFDQTNPLVWQYVLAHYHFIGRAAGGAVYERQSQ